MAAVARDQRVDALVRQDFSIPESDATHGRSPSVWVILGKSLSDLGPLANAARWRPLRLKRGIDVWTDDFSDIIRVMKH
jgi:hypothetical protein